MKRIVLIGALLAPLLLCACATKPPKDLSLIHISEPTKSGLLADEPAA